MAKLLMLPVVEGAEDTVHLDDLEVLLKELVGDTFEDTVISDSGRVVYVSESVETKVTAA